MKVYLETLGCKLNESELEAWMRKFSAEGAQIVSDPSGADICVLNTCTVTASAARKSRNIARQMARKNPSARLVLTGCYASIAPNEARSMPNVAMVVLNAEKERLVQMTRGLLPTGGCTEAAEGSPFDDPPSIKFTDSNSSVGEAAPRTRAFVKIQDGCNMSCTYCIIPIARGRERSRPISEVVAEVQALVNSGYKEIILTGVQISQYRSGNGDLLEDLVAAILHETSVPRLRLTSIAPWDLDGSLLDLFSDPHLCRHLHLSLQSGSDATLRRMRRPYTTGEFAAAVNMIHSRIPDAAITTDVIVGFPGESDDEFEESLAFVERMEFARVHVFPYSARVGTLAAGLAFQVLDATKEMRSRRMQAAANEAARAFASRFIGRTVEVLWEHAEAVHGETHGGQWPGYTDNYLRVVTQSSTPLHNRIAAAQLNQVTSDGTVVATCLGG